MVAGLGTFLLPGKDARPHQTGGGGGIGDPARCGGGTHRRDRFGKAKVRLEGRTHLKHGIDVLWETLGRLGFEVEWPWWLQRRQRSRASHGSGNDGSGDIRGNLHWNQHLLLGHEGKRAAPLAEIATDVSLRLQGDKDGACDVPPFHAHSKHGVAGDLHQVTGALEEIEGWGILRTVSGRFYLPTSLELGAQGIEQTAAQFSLLSRVGCPCGGGAKR